MTLQVDIQGKGRPLVLLHGWSLHSGVFDAIVPALSKDFELHLVDLPGHGHNAAEEMPPTIEQAAERILDSVPERAHWLGWSIGGTAAMAAAIAAPERIERMVTVAATPRFVAADDWPHAIPKDTLEGMAADLATDFEKTVKNFLSLQVHGDEHARDMLRDLRQRLYAHGRPGETSLANGLDILHDSDLREAVKGIEAPWLSIMGSRDRLASPQVGDWLERNVPNCSNLTIHKAAHAPFLSHADEFLRAVTDFLGS
ncbi:MAG: pimeloyl-ACP methyl ester esterase BioH [Gammaproteobacteria bacterium]|nr:pimeloyl-ACP methyl ester esterase BioH [Gammaproteobacteria bacterium]